MAAGVPQFRGRMSANYRPNDAVYTPKYVFDALGLQFDLDVCGPEGGLPWIPAKRTFSEIEDGLVQQWYGRVWMNPPYSKPSPWVDKWLENGNGVMLAPFSKSHWFMKLWNSEAAILTNPVNFKFMKPDGSNYAIAFPTAFWAIGETNITALKMSGLGVIR